MNRIGKDMKMNLEEILEQSPDLPGYGGGKWAIYSISCCWWTSFPEDLGESAPMKWDPETGRISHNPGGHGLPCCPHCGSLLMQAPLEKFVAEAREHPDYYGKLGLEVFVRSHSRNSKRCFRDWDRYEAAQSPDDGRFA
jgi:hypothetical protein